MSDAHEPQHEHDAAADADFQQWGNEVGDAPDLPAADATDGVAQPSAATGESTELDAARQALAERTEDLQRLQAEYVNYKRRVDRDRDVARHAGVESVVTDLLPVLDAIDSAREHGELTGGFKLVADELQRLAGKYGLEAYGEAGDEFDPHIHEAMMTAPSTPGQTTAQAASVLQRGYRLGERIVRHARVAVSEPDPGAASSADESH